LWRRTPPASVTGVREQRGQATVELLGVVPAVLVAGLVVWQLILVGHTAWMAANAARVAARAQLVGEDASRAARSALPAGLARGLEVERTNAGATRVRVEVPIMRRAWQRRVQVSAAASLEAAR
jgi:hypothetical protein